MTLCYCYFSKVKELLTMTLKPPYSNSLCYMKLECFPLEKQSLFPHYFDLRLDCVICLGQQNEARVIACQQLSVQVFTGPVVSSRPPVPC
jgi:hypothetical protein